MPSVTPDSGAASLTGQTLFVAPQSIRPDAGSLTVTGNTPTVIGNRGAIQPAAGAISINGLAPGSNNIVPNTGSLGLFSNHPWVRTNEATAGLTWGNPAQMAELTLVMGWAPLGIVNNRGPGYVRQIIDNYMGPIRDPRLLSFYYQNAPDAPPVQRSTISNAQGNPTPPSQQQGIVGYYTSYVIVQAGTWTVTIDALVLDQDSDYEPTSLSVFAPFPRLTIKANPDVGLLADVVADGIQVAGWQTLTATFTVTATGAVEVRREKRGIGMADSVFWDNFTATPS